MYSHSITGPPLLYKPVHFWTDHPSHHPPKYNVSLFCLPIIYKINNSIYTKLYFNLQNFQWYHTCNTCLQKRTQFTLLKKIKSFVVFEMNEGQLVVISSDEEDEVIITKKPKLEESVLANRDAFFSIKSVLGDWHCIVNCFSTFFEKATSEVLDELWQEFHNNIEEYMKFGEYENSEQLLQCLQQYIFGKNYDHDTICIEYLCLKTQLTILLAESLEKDLPSV